MPFSNLKKKENLLAIQEWCDCDKRRKELGRPILASEIEMKLSFIEWLDTPIFEYKPPKRQIWKRLKRLLGKHLG